MSTKRYLRSQAIAALLVVASAGGLLSGCGGQSSSARLRSRLLSVSDLPAGWSVAGTGSSTRPRLTDTPCLAEVAKRPPGWSYQTAAFVEGKSIPNLGEVLATGTRVGQAFVKANGRTHETLRPHRSARRGAGGHARAA